MSQPRGKRKTGAGRSSGLTERLARTSALHPWLASRGATSGRTP